MAKRNDTVALLIATYNWPEALLLCLKSVEGQTRKPDEILIADDGSTESTRQLIDQYRLKLDVPIKHIWHEDDGFRLTVIRNKAIAAAESDYIIQIDGDVILHKHFIKDHMLFAKPGHFVTGSRVNLNKNFSQQLLTAERLPTIMEIRQNGKNFYNSLRLPLVSQLLGEHYKTKGKHKYTTRGCNMAFWRADILSVNGYNEAMIGWGSEDEELVVRMINAGLKKRFIKISGIVFHLWHSFTSKTFETVNLAIYKEAIQEKKTTITNGVSKYLNKELCGLRLLLVHTMLLLG